MATGGRAMVQDLRDMQTSMRQRESTANASEGLEVKNYINISGI